MALQPTSDQIDIPLPPPPALSDSQRFIPTPFLTKTYRLVDDVSINAIISWNEDGTTFVVWNPAEFACDILPKYFKHNNFSSFVRQLNTYGFRKVMPDRWEFSNDCFRRGDKRLLCDIVRRKLTAAASASASASGGTVASSSVLSLPVDPLTSNSGEGVFSTNSTPSAAVAAFAPVPSTVLFLEQENCNSNNGSTNIHNHRGNGHGSGYGSRATLMDENDRLKKENTQLSKELKQMNSMCTNIYSMMANCNPGSGSVPSLGHGPGPPIHGAGGCGSSNSSQAESIINPLHLMASQRLLALPAVVETHVTNAPVVIPAALEDPLLSSRLFGFRLGFKRARGADDKENPMEQDDLLQLQQPGPR